MKISKKQKKNLIRAIFSIAIILIALVMGVINKNDILTMLNISAVNSVENFQSLLLRKGKENGRVIEDIDNKNSEKIIQKDVGIEEYKVLRVIDGDTIQIEYKGKKEKLRLIGIDTPESVHPDSNKNIEEGKTAAIYTKELLENNYIRLEFDVQKRDKYGRLLAYVYINDEMINKKLLEEGYAKLATYPPNVKYVDDFTKIQKEARGNKRGFWGE